MRPLTYIRTHADWIALFFILVILLVAGLFIYDDSQRSVLPSSTYDTPNLRNFYTVEHEISLQEIVAPDPKYPPLGKEQRGFWRSYTHGDIQYSLYWMERNIERNASIGPHTFMLELYNARNQAVTINAEAAKPFTIGCAAYD